jgi:uncharacterized tellurite resistance protein B-like protein
MANFQRIAERVAVNGGLEDQELGGLRRVVYADGKVNRQEADFLARLRQLMRHRTSAFDQFFYRAVADHVLADGRLTDYEAAWLRQMVIADAKIDDGERQLLRQLKWGGRRRSARSSRRSTGSA